MIWCKCHYLNSDIELTRERERHIEENHPDLLPEHFAAVLESIKNPDQVCKSKRAANTKLFCKWFDEIRNGKYVIVVVMCEEKRKRVLTAYLTNKIRSGEVEWERI